MNQSLYTSPDSRFYVKYSGLGRLFFVWDRRALIRHPVASAHGLPAAIRECDAAYRRSLA
jgi:hypothetical protein